MYEEKVPVNVYLSKEAWDEVNAFFNKIGKNRAISGVLNDYLVNMAKTIKRAGLDKKAEKMTYFDVLKMGILGLKQKV